MRVIARLDVKNEFVIKGIHLEGLRKVGDPNTLAKAYYEAGIDEIVFMDAVASLYERNNLFKIIELACKDIFIPITLGGGIRSLSDIGLALRSGADKVAINTAAVKNISLVEESAKKYGSQCIVGSIQAKRNNEGWEAYIENGREPTGIDVVSWAKQLESAGCGEIVVTSVDMEGTKRGFDVPLIQAVQESVSCPIIVSGGYGKTTHLQSIFKCVVPSAIAVASVLHYGLDTISNIKEEILDQGVPVRC